MSYRLYLGSELANMATLQFPRAWNPAVMNVLYCATTREWIDGPFAKYFRDYLTARGDLVWKTRGNQCEHFALRAALEAVHLFSHMEDPQIPAEAESLAVMACKYFRSDGKGWHEANLWLLAGIWEPWEPQTQTFFTFTPDERNTVQQLLLP